MRDALVQWLDESVADEAVRQRLTQPWLADSEVPAGPELLDRLVETISQVLPEARELRSFCLGPQQDGSVPEFPVPGISIFGQISPDTLTTGEISLH